tara:strand:- start:4019 stop:4792 length:774 start_codon:yes stop_codon:yes gene_type:complete
LALYFDFSALENFVIALSASEFVGYPIPELLGAERGTSVVAQVQRIEILFTILVIAYSFFFVGLSFMKEADRRMRYFAGGIATPLFFGLLVFWLKFIEDDHIISKAEKYELFEYTIGCLVLSVLLFTYSFRSKKRPRPSLSSVEAQAEEDFEGGGASAESEGEASSEEEGVLPRPDSEDQPPSESEDRQTTPGAVEELSSPEPLEEPAAIEPLPESDDLASPGSDLPLAELELGYPSADEVPPPSTEDAENLKPDRP